MKHVAHFLHYLFVPSEKNNFRAKLIQHDLLSMYVCILLLLTIVIRQGNMFGHTGQVLGIATDVNIPKLMEDVNIERAKNNLPPLQINTKLSEAAEHKAENMFQENYWAHFAPSGKTPWDFINGVSYRYDFAGENLAKNFLYSQNVVDAWMDSPTHRENILRPEFTEVGYAVRNGVLNGEETTLVVQMFARPTIGIETAAQEPAPQTQPITQLPQQQPGRVLAQMKQAAPTPSPALNLVSVFLAILVIIFAIDFYMATKMKVIRLHGNSAAHLVFLLIIGAGVVFFLTKGAIL